MPPVPKLQTVPTRKCIHGAQYLVPLYMLDGCDITWTSVGVLARHPAQALVFFFGGNCNREDEGEPLSLTSTIQRRPRLS